MKQPIAYISKALSCALFACCLISTSTVQAQPQPTGYDSGGGEPAGQIIMDSAQPPGSYETGQFETGQFDSGQFDSGQWSGGQDYGYYPQTYEQLPQDKGWFYESDFDRFIGQAAKQVWFEIEYLAWDITDPGPTIVGAPATAAFDFSNGSDVSDRNSGDAFFGYSTDLRTIGLDANNGIRGTIGLPTVYGDISASIWGLQKNSAETSRIDLADSGVLEGRAVIPTLIGGVPRTNDVAIVFDGFLVANYQTSMMGVDVDHIFKPDRAGTLGLHISPSMGLYYVSLEEDLTVFDEVAAVRTQKISSNASNEMYGAKVGLNARFNHEWFTLNANTQMMLGLNREGARVITNELFAVGDPTRDTNDTGTEFSPAVKAKLQAKFHVRKHISLFIGYDAMYFMGVTRPATNIYWNDEGTGSPPATVARRESEQIFLQGISFGGEFRY